MSRLAIKICGLSTSDTVGAAIRAGATHLGFVHFAKSPRHVEADQLRALAATVPAHIERVAVLVDPTDETHAGRNVNHRGAGNADRFGDIVDAEAS